MSYDGKIAYPALVHKGVVSSEKRSHKDFLGYKNSRHL
jgi:hypothetical protein